jgi:hypothetical protein
MVVIVTGGCVGAADMEGVLRFPASFIDRLRAALAGDAADGVVSDRPSSHATGRLRRASMLANRGGEGNAAPRAIAEIRRFSAPEAAARWSRSVGSLEVVASGGCGDGALPGQSSPG